MSSASVRNSFRSRVLAAALPVPYVETVYTPVDRKQLPAGGWVTLDFLCYGEERISLGDPGCFRESGQVDFTIAVPASQGDAAMLAIAEALRTAFRHYADNGLRVSDLSPLTEPDSGDNRGAWAIGSFTVDYSFDRFG
jgi:hypothetical protein